MTKRKMWISIGILLLATISAIVIIKIIEQRKLARQQLEQALEMDFAQHEQQRVGINCQQLKGQLVGFLDTTIKPLINARQANKGWNNLITEQVKQDIEKHDDYARACLRIYRASIDGESSVLQGLSYLEGVAPEILSLAADLKYGGFASSSCNEDCLNTTFERIKTSYDRAVFWLQNAPNSLLNLKAKKRQST